MGFQMTAGRFLTLGMSCFLLDILLIPIVEGVLKLQGATAWIAVAGLFTVIGGGTAIIGAILNNAEQSRMILGADDAFCQLTIYIDRDGPGWFLSNLHAGAGGAIYDVQVLITEVTENGRPVKEQIVPVGTMTSNTWPLTLYPLGQPKDLTESGRPRYFNAQATHRNGVAIQELVVYPRPKGFVEIGFLRLEVNGKPHEPSGNLLNKNISTLIKIPEAEITRIRQLRDAERERMRRRLNDPNLDLTLDREKL
jgi:hypothetical protein